MPAKKTANTEKPKTVRDLRNALGYTLLEVSGLVNAELIAQGVSTRGKPNHQTIYFYEAGRNVPSGPRLRALAKIYQVTVPELSAAFLATHDEVEAKTGFEYKGKSHSKTKTLAPETETITAGN